MSEATTINNANLCEKFEELGEIYAAGFYEEPSKPLFIRYSRALRRYLEKCTLIPYNGEPVYPCGPKFQDKLLITPSFSFTLDVKWGNIAREYPELLAVLQRDLNGYVSSVPNEHRIGGNMYTHSYPNFKRIVAEGLDSYEERVKGIADESVRLGLLDLLVGIRNYHSRIMQHLKDAGAQDSELYKALTKVPFKPAETLYEALVCWNFVYYLDGCDDIGRMDADLIRFYKGEDVVEVLRCFFKNVDANDGWSGTLGPEYNELTLQCIKAVKGLRRPSLELRVTRDMPEEIWDAAIDSIKAGGGSPSLYNEDAYQSALERIFPYIPKEDRINFAGGGCTETMLAGMSCVGSLDAGINTALIFERYMRSELGKAKSFEEFYNGFIDQCHSETLRVLNSIRESEKNRSIYRPHPMRTLLIDDCIDKGKDYNNGGARYYWSVVNLAGMVNVIDSLLVINNLVFKDKKFSGEQILKQLDEGETFLGYTDIPRHGTDKDEALEMARRVTTDITKHFSEVKPYFGGEFLPSSIQFTEYVRAGLPVGATPDGRAAGAPLCDSIGAIHGNDCFGATAMLNSAAAFCQENMSGTPVLNIKLDPDHADKALKGLTLGYFSQGGMQMQVTCVNKDDLLDAMVHPENHRNLVVRIGGYSEYFTRLSPELQKSVIKRTFSK